MTEPTMPELPEPSGDKCLRLCSQNEPAQLMAWSATQMHEYARQYAVWLEARVKELEQALSLANDLSTIMRMPNAEYVSDAHNEAVRSLRAAIKKDTP